MKKVIWGIVIIIVVIIIGLSFGNKDKETGVIKIGFIGPLSGDAAIFGETEKNATQMVIDKLNSNGGLEGRLVEVVYEDGKCAGKDSTLAISKLINVDKVKAVLGGVCSSETLAAAPIAEENKVLMFSSFSSNPSVTDSGDFVFRNSPSDTDVAKVDAQLIVSKGYKRVAMISENNDYAQGVKTIMNDLFTKENIEVVMDENFNSGNTDFRSFVTKVKSLNPDVVYINPGSSGKTGALFVKQAKEAGIISAIHGNFSLGTPDAFEIGGATLNGVIISDSVEVSDELASLISEYESEFGSKPANDFEFGASYDRVNIIIQAIDEVGYDSEKIKNYLYNLKSYEGVIGTYSFDENGDVVGGPFFTNYLIENSQKKGIN